ncbi:MAG: hypothetical protein PHV59_12995, partial [Victivallales bacterium]|nr:hypothetical protein [Victivallales bacterium]
IDFETKRKIVELMIKQVIIDKKKITIEYFIPIKKCNLRLVGDHPTTTLSISISEPHIENQKTARPSLPFSGSVFHKYGGVIFR